MALKAPNPAVAVLIQTVTEAINEAYNMGRAHSYGTVAQRALVPEVVRVRQAILEAANIHHFGRSRSKTSVPPKWAAVVMLRDRCQLSFPEIAGFLGYADHTTMMYAYRHQSRYPEIAEIIAAATKLLDEQKEEV